MTQPAPAARDGARPGKKTIAGVMGGAAIAAALMGALTTLEGNKNVGYRDIVGIPTNCMGNTRNVVVGKYYPPAECDRINEEQAVAHAEIVRKCTPRIEGNQLQAAVLLAYNIGGSAYCKSTVARRFNAARTNADLRAACDGFLAWNRAGGRVIKGLVNRRAFERSLCVKGL